MIAADQITFDGDTAWFVPPDAASALVYWQLDRPCDNHMSLLSNPPQPCPDCIDGRHAFDIGVDISNLDAALANHRPGDRVLHYEAGRSFRAYRVSIVPGMVLPIVADEDDLPDCPPLVCIDPPAYWPEGSTNPGEEIPITLPPAAKPGMWAVKLKVLP